MSANPTLFYVVDPMCSWCWAFRPAWLTLLEGLPAQVEVRYLMGGLAPDCDEPMGDAMRQRLQAVWHEIAERTGAEFNHDFWRLTTPRRSTWPACRAVIAAGRRLADGRTRMIETIQRGYYLEARNPSESDVLCDFAREIGLDRDQFADDLISSDVDAEFHAGLLKVRQWGVHGFPTVLAGRGDEPTHVLTRGWVPAATLLERWHGWLARAA
jgi:putative protein-disulfide isomerase